ncbi:VWA domain-containing protein [Cryobacterium sp. TMT2-15-1]|nr:VWA domain-containing protein [Cryobacterium sp. TMT2-15-1]
MADRGSLGLRSIDHVGAGRSHVEAAALAVGFSTALRRAGVPSSPDRSARLAEALRLVPPHEREPLYWTCRVVLVSAREQVPVFDAVFDAVFAGTLDPADFRGDQNAPPSIGSEPRTRPTATHQRPAIAADQAPLPQAPGMAPGGDDSGDTDTDAPERETILVTAADEERLHQMSFTELAPDEVAQMRRLVRRLILLCDVSGSMEPYTRVYLSLLQGAVAGAEAEAFIFSTGLTRLTRQLAVRDPDQALARAAASTQDWAGGTRLAESIRHFTDAWGRRGLARGAVVVIISDGWALDDPESVHAQMARLRRLAYRIIWVNPRKVALDYQPVVGGMAAALPFVDAFVSGHSYAALAEVAAAIRADRSDPHENTRAR